MAKNLRHMSADELGDQLRMSCEELGLLVLVNILRGAEVGDGG